MLKKRETKSDSVELFAYMCVCMSVCFVHLFFNFIPFSGRYIPTGYELCSLCVCECALHCSVCNVQ